MTREERQDRLRQLARIDRKMAELYADRARIQDELADERVDPVTNKPPQRRKLPPVVEVSELDQARANKLLTGVMNRRRARA